MDKSEQIKFIEDSYPLYDNANFYLSRKFNKFNYYANTEDVQIITNACKAQEVNVNESNNLPTSSEHSEMDENIC